MRKAKGPKFQLHKAQWQIVKKYGITGVNVARCSKCHQEVFLTSALPQKCPGCLSKMMNRAVVVSMWN